MSVSLVIRTFTAEDAAENQRLRLRALIEHPEAFSSSYEKESKATLEQVAEKLGGIAKSQDEFILGAFKGIQLVGMVGFYRELMDKERHKGFLWGMYVAPEARSHKVGRKLLQELIKRAGSLVGLTQIRTGVVTTNEAARNLYKQLGFESYGIEKNALYVNGNYYDMDLLVLGLR
ncbi:MAG: GNAT family N-acetyltransferase [Chloroflexi bacterium]|nr:GNAT family N-acetyltransferase [Chloroflexota bacterium]